MMKRKVMIWLMILTLLHMRAGDEEGETGESGGHCLARGPLILY
jgi:hypothetical protein